MFQLRRLVEALVSEQVEFVILGGVALTMQGSTRVTHDLDVCYERSPLNFSGSLGR